MIYSCRVRLVIRDGCFVSFLIFHARKNPARRAFPFLVLLSSALTSRMRRDLGKTRALRKKKTNWDDVLFSVFFHLWVDVAKFDCYLLNSQLTYMRCKSTNTQGVSVDVYMAVCIPCHSGPIESFVPEPQSLAYAYCGRELLDLNERWRKQLPFNFIRQRH